MLLLFVLYNLFSGFGQCMRFCCFSPFLSSTTTAKQYMKLQPSTIPSEPKHIIKFQHPTFNYQHSSINNDTPLLPFIPKLLPKICDMSSRKRPCHVFEGIPSNSSQEFHRLKYLLIIFEQIYVYIIYVYIIYRYVDIYRYRYR